MALSTMMANYWKLLPALANVSVGKGLSECTTLDLELDFEGCVCRCECV